MANRLKNEQAPERPPGRGEERRALILQALHDCIIDKGYAKTSLKDIAESAGMSPSHLLYYFSGKDEILDHYFETVAARIITRVESFRDEPVDQQIDHMAELFFGGKGITMSEVGFMLECFGAAVHDEKLHKEKTEMDRVIKNCLQDLFKQRLGDATRARDAAEVAYAALIGLRTATFFDERVSLSRALRLFRAVMLRLAGDRTPD